MGKIIYNPQAKQEEKEVIEEHVVSMSEKRLDTLIENLQSVKPVGDIECDYAIYMEDYVYTYLYQYAQTDLACEHSATLVGEYYPETKEIIICGALPIPKHRLAQVNEWINEEAVAELQEEKEKYFPGTSILGWLHMQPGYGIMLTMKEVKVHRELFDRDGQVCLLIDPINHLETFYVYEGDTLREQSGYYIYYDKNTCMQQYMLDKPFVCQEKEEADDEVVTQFRELGQRRKREYQQRKKTNFTVVAASIVLLALSAVLLRVMEQGDQLNDVQNAVQASGGIQTQQPATTNQQTPAFIFDNAQGSQETPSVQIVPQTGTQTGQATEESTEQGATESVNPVTPEVDEVAQAETPQQEEVVVDVTEEVVEAFNETEATTPEDEAVVADYQTYVVESGDTVRSISLTYFDTELRAKEIIQFNALEDGDHIFVGQELKIPLE